MKTALMFVPLAIVLLFAGCTVVMCAQPGMKVVKSSAQAWVWVAPDQQKRFVGELCEFARTKNFKCNPSTLPGLPWTMAGVIIVTPKENEIAIINATAPNKFAADITILHPEPKWQNYWNDFRAYVSARHKWQDIP